MNLKQIFQKNKFIVTLLFIVFILRIPSLFEPYWYGDEGIYLTLGLAIKKGFLLYRDIFDNKPPLIYLLAAVANGTMFWFRFLLMISVLATILFFHKLGRALQINDKSIKVSTVVFSLLTTIPFIEGNIANAEIFILLPTILAIYLLSPYLFSKERVISPLKIFLIGIIFGVGLLLKVPAVFDFFTIIVFLVLFKKENSLVNIGRKEILLILGYSLPVLITGLFFLSKSAFSVFFNSCFLQTTGYLFSWKTGSHTFSYSSLLKSGLVLNVMLTFFLTFILWLKKKKTDSLLVFLAIWFLFSLFAATLSGRPYSHYLLQTVPPFSLIIGVFLTKQIKKHYLVFAITIFLLISNCLHYKFWTYPTFSYYRNFTEFALGKKDKSSYFSFFSQKMPQIYKLAEFITESTQPQDKIFIWADEPCLYPLSRRLPATPYVVAYHIIERGNYQAAGKQILYAKPALIVFDPNIEKFPQLEAILAKEYLEVNSTAGFMVFKRRAL